MTRVAPCHLLARSAAIAATMLVLAAPGFTNPPFLPFANLSAASGQSGMFGSVVKVDLLDEMMVHDGRYFVGVRMHLQDGWRSYWRVAGSSGLPTRMFISDSVNVSSSRIHWPAPSLVDQFGDTSIGYVGEVVFPIEIYPSDLSNENVTLNSAFSFGICKDVCIPITRNIDIELANLAMATDSGLLASAFDNMPRSRIALSNESAIDCIDLDISGRRIEARVALPGAQNPSRLKVLLEDVHQQVLFTPPVLHQVDASTLLVQSEVAFFFGEDRNLLPEDIRMLLVNDMDVYDLPGCPAD